MLTPTQHSLDVVREISHRINNQTFHHHYHVLLDIAQTYPDDQILDYLEIGCYAGGSACLMLQRPYTAVTSIDLGHPVPPSVVQTNVALLNHRRNEFRYVQGNSNDPAVVAQINNRKYDIIFIDGDHTYHGVWRDFLIYSPLLKPQGYLVFDDYNDAKHSPAVRSAVDHIANQLRTRFDVVGALPNHLGARPSDMTSGNCFILRQREALIGPSIAITTATYARSDGSTPKFLEKTLDSVMQQTYTNWHLFLIGDRYDPAAEITQLLANYPRDRISWTNLAVANERDHCDDPAVLWRTGGVNAFNVAIDQALEAGFEYVAHLDHDDTWSPDHLAEIAEAINLTGASWICTKARHSDGQILPKTIEQHAHLIPYTPMYSSVIHSSVCMNFRHIPLRYRDLWKQCRDKNRASDSDLWERSRQYILRNDLRSLVINRVTCEHQQEHTGS